MPWYIIIIPQNTPLGITYCTTTPFRQTRYRYNSRNWTQLSLLFVLRSVNFLYGSENLNHYIKNNYFCGRFKNFRSIYFYEKFSSNRKLVRATIREKNSTGLKVPIITSRRFQGYKLVDVTSNTFYKCTATFRTQICIKCLRTKLNGFKPV
jgi:hypothetical protein